MSKSGKTPVGTGSRRPEIPNPIEGHAATPDDPRSAGREEGDSPKPAESATGAAEGPGPTADQVSAHFAGHLAQSSGAAFMYFSMASIFPQADSLAFKKFRDN